MTLPGRYLARMSISSSEGPSETENFNIAVLKIFLMGGHSGFFSEVLLTQKSPFGAIRANLKMVFLRKIHFFAYPIWAQNGHILTQEGPI